MPIYQQIPLRLQVSTVSNPPVAPVDTNTGLTPQVWRGQTAAFAVGVFDADGNAVDLTNLAYMQMILQAEQGSTVPLAVVQVDAADITDDLTVGPWLAGTAQNAIFEFTAADLDQGLGAATSKDFWIILVGYTGAGAPLIYGAGALSIYNAGSSLPARVPTLTSLHKQTTAAGNVTVTPTSQLHTEIVTVDGDARTSGIILGISGAQAGAQLFLILNLPSTADIVMEVHSNLISNPVISTMQTGSVLQSRLEYYFDDDLVAWVPQVYLNPPT